MIYQYERSTPVGKLHRPSPPPLPPMPAIIAEGIIENFGTWTLDKNDLLTIDGKGDMPEWNWSECPWKNIKFHIKSVQISEGITSISAQVFERCYSLTNITIPASVTHIGAAAFFHCSSLLCVTMASGVTEIGKGAFAFCKRLTSITLPNSVAKVGKDIFFQCYNLKQVTMPANALLWPSQFPASYPPEMFFRYYFGISKDIVTFT